MISEEEKKRRMGFATDEAVKVPSLLPKSWLGPHSSRVSMFRPFLNSESSDGALPF